MSGSNPDRETKQPTSLGIYDRPGAPSVSGIEIAAVVLSLIWLVVSVVFLVLPGRVETSSFIVTLLAVFMPVAMIWVAAMAMRASRIMREESARLQTAIDAIRNAYMSRSSSAPPVRMSPPSARSWMKSRRRRRRRKPYWRRFLPAGGILNGLQPARPVGAAPDHPQRINPALALGHSRPRTSARTICRPV